MIKRKTITIAALVLCTQAVAGQNFKLMDGDSIEAAISPSHLNRIYLKNDRIEGVKSLDGQFHGEHDERSGELYIKPTLTHIDKPMHLYLSSEQGFSYSVTLLPNVDTPQTLMLDNRQAQKPDAGTQDDQDEVHQLLAAMHSGKGNDDFVRQNLSREVLQTVRNELAVSHIANFWGNDYFGEVLVVTNDSRRAKILHESDLSDENTVALVLLTRTLDRAQYTFAYRIKRNA